MWHDCSVTHALTITSPGDNSYWPPGTAHSFTFQRAETCRIRQITKKVFSPGWDSPENDIRPMGHSGIKWSSAWFWSSVFGLRADQSGNCLVFILAKSGLLLGFGVLTLAYGLTSQGTAWCLFRHKMVFHLVLEFSPWLMGWPVMELPGVYSGKKWSSAWFWSSVFGL